MRTMAASIAIVMRLVPGVGAWSPGVEGIGLNDTDQQAQATRVVVLKVEGMT